MATRIECATGSAAARQASTTRTAPDAVRSRRASQRTGPHVRRQHAERPDAQARTEHPRDRPQPGRVGGQLDERVEVAHGAEQVDRAADGREQQDVADQPPGPQEAGAWQHGAEQRHAERAPHRAGAPEADPVARWGPVASRMLVHESKDAASGARNRRDTATRVGREFRRARPWIAGARPRPAGRWSSTAVCRRRWRSRVPTSGGSLWTARLLGEEPERIAAAHRAFFESGRAGGDDGELPGQRRGARRGRVRRSPRPGGWSPQRDDRARGARRARRRAAGAAGGRVGRALRSVPGRRVGVHRAGTTSRPRGCATSTARASSCWPKPGPTCWPSRRSPTPTRPRCWSSCSTRSGCPRGSATR